MWAARDAEGQVVAGAGKSPSHPAHERAEIVEKVGIVDDARHLVLPADLAPAFHPGGKAARRHGAHARCAEAEVSGPVLAIVIVGLCQMGIDKAGETLDAIRCRDTVCKFDNEQMRAGRCVLHRGTGRRQNSR